MIKTKTRNSLNRVAIAVSEGAKFSYELADWLDDFYAQPEQESLIEEPCFLAAKVKNGHILDAYIAATASQLCKQYGWPLPAWVWDKNRILQDPWFAETHEFLRATLLLDSPGSFRERNLFVSADALVRV